MSGGLFNYANETNHRNNKAKRKYKLSYWDNFDRSENILKSQLQ